MRDLWNWLFHRDDTASKRHDSEETSDTTSDESEGLRVSVEAIQMRTIDLELKFPLGILGVERDYFSNENEENAFTLLNPLSNGLPIGVWIQVMTVLNIKSIIQVSRRCKTFYNIVFSDETILTLLISAKYHKEFMQHIYTPTIDVSDYVKATPLAGDSHLETGLRSLV